MDNKANDNLKPGIGIDFSDLAAGLGLDEDVLLERLAETLAARAAQPGGCDA